MHTLTRRASFWVAAAVAAIALWTSGAPTVTYPLYAAEWNLQPSVTTAIFAVYPIVLVVVLVLFGNISDYIGRRAAILLGLLSLLIGVLLFAIAPNVAVVFVGRALMGVGVALSLSPATAAMVEFSAKGKEKRASSITTAATAVGLALATLVGGGLIQYAPFPTHLNFWVLFAAIAVVTAFAWFLPRHTAAEAQGRWRPRLPAIPRGIRRYYVTSTLAVTTGFAIGAVMMSLGASIAKDLVGSTNAFVTGAVLSIFAVVVGIAAVLAGGIRPQRVIVMGGISTIFGMLLLLLSSVEHSLPVFLAASVVMGAGYSLLFLGGLSVISANAPAHHRAATVSAVYLVAYLFQGLIALALGAVATNTSLQVALDAAIPTIVLLSLGAIGFAASIRAPRLPRLA